VVGEYFENLPPWDEKTDHLKDLVKTVKTENQKRFEETLKKFFVGVIDCLLEPDAVNDVCLVFQSGQGIGKSRWMRSILPKHFQSEYLYEGNIDTSDYWNYYLGFRPGFANIDPDVLDIEFKDGKVIRVRQHDT
jgi:predicted P-loop ATPase